MPAAYYDGTFTSATVAGPLESEHVFDYWPNVLMFRQKFWQNINNFTPLALNTTGATSGMDPVHPTACYLIEETPRIGLGGDIVEWERVWVHLPPPHSVLEGTASYSYKVPYATPLGVFSISLDLPQLKTWSYHLTGSDVVIHYVRDVVVVGTILLELNGGVPIGGFPSGTVVYNRASDVHLWHGLIYEVIDYSVTIIG